MLNEVLHDRNAWNIVNFSVFPREALEANKVFYMSFLLNSTISNWKCASLGNKRDYRIRGLDYVLVFFCMHGWFSFNGRLMKGQSVSTLGFV